MVQKDVDQDFTIHGSVREMSGGALSNEEIKSNLLSAKKWRTIGIERTLKVETIDSFNKSTIIEGFAQGADQCFSTCVVAWAGMQNSESLRTMNAKKDSLHAEIGNIGGTIVVLEQKCRNGKSLAENITSVLDGELTKEHLNSGDLQARHTGEGEIKVGEREGNLLKEGGGLILQDGAHFRLVFMESSGIIKIFDPLGGKSKTIDANEIYNYVSPRNEDTDLAAILELKTHSDFIMM